LKDEGKRILLARLMDYGLQKLTKLLIEMSELSEKSIEAAIDGYVNGQDLQNQIFDDSERLRDLSEEVSDLAVELIARYQPVASDLRFIRSCMEISYGFFRFGRYAYDIAQVLHVFGDLSNCDHKVVGTMATHVKEMVRMSVSALTQRDVKLAEELTAKDDLADKMYEDHVSNIMKAGGGASDLKCSMSATLILRYLERIADHATYIGDSVIYIVTGQKVRTGRTESSKPTLLTN
jgi:phosphate transport system protein